MKLSRIVCAVLVGTGLVFAQAAAPAAAPAAKAQSVNGKVVSVSGDTLIVKVGKKDDTLFTSAATVVKKGTAAATLADLTAGANVKVTFKTEAGKKDVTEVVEKVAAAKKTTAAPKDTTKK
jgi:hypothetical protein